jgi:RsiW-degrading membrane proteinase PrsW (M82 family)
MENVLIGFVSVLVMAVGYIDIYCLVDHNHPIDIAILCIAFTVIVALLVYAYKYASRLIDKP